MAGQPARHLAPVSGGLRPGQVIVLRAQLIDHYVQDQVDWHEVAEAAEKIAAFARGKQQRAWARVRSWDAVPDPDGQHGGAA